GSVQSHLAKSNVVHGADSLTPRIDTRSVKVTGSCSIVKEKRERLALIYPFLTYRIRVNHTLRPNLISILIQVQVIAAHVWRGVVDAPNLTLLTCLHLVHNRVNGRGRVVDVA